MKKILLLLVLFFPIIVLGIESNKLESDDVHLEKANVRVVVSNKSLSIEKQLNTQIIYGEKASTYYMDFNLPNIYGMYNANKSNVEEQKANISKLNIESQTNYEILDVENGKQLRFGEDYGIFPETENLLVSYDLEFNTNIENYSFPIYFSDYNTNNLVFSLYIAKNYAKDNILFSLNNKDFSKELDGLSLTSEESGIIYGKYNKKMNKGDTLYLLITSVDVQPKTINDKSLIIILSIIGACILFVGGYYFKTKKK